MSEYIKITADEVKVGDEVRVTEFEPGNGSVVSTTTVYAGVVGEVMTEQVVFSDECGTIAWLLEDADGLGVKVTVERKQSAEDELVAVAGAEFRPLLRDESMAAVADFLDGEDFMGGASIRALATYLGRMGK